MRIKAIHDKTGSIIKAVRADTGELIEGVSSIAVKYPARGIPIMTMKVMLFDSAIEEDTSFIWSDACDACHGHPAECNVCEGFMRVSLQKEEQCATCADSECPRLLTVEEVMQLARNHQGNLGAHPFTCGNNSHHVLKVISTDGVLTWACDECDYVQGMPARHVAQIVAGYGDQIKLVPGNKPGGCNG